MDIFLDENKYKKINNKYYNDKNIMYIVQKIILMQIN